MSLYVQWAGALSGMVLRHPNRVSDTAFQLSQDVEPVLVLTLDRHLCSVDDHAMEDFTIGCVRLTYFPGPELARIWLAAAWAGYLQHESLELVLGPDGQRVLDPHGPGFADRGLRQGVPPVLTPETLRASLAVVMSRRDADALIALKSHL